VSWHSHSGVVIGVAVSSDGRWVVSAGSDGMIRIADHDHPESAPQGWLTPQSFLTSVAVSGDGLWVASGGDDGTVFLWNREHPKASPLMWRGHEISVNSVAVSRDGRWIIVGQGDGTLLTAAVRASDLKAKACKLAARNLSGTEWQLYLGDEPYRETCPGQLRPDKVEGLTPKADVDSSFLPPS
jgi:WD40 repeat protein